MGAAAPQPSASDAPPRVGFLVPTLSPSGGLSVILGHARRLPVVAGMQTEVIVTGDVDRTVDGVTVRSLEDARGERYDIVVATWWTTAELAWELYAQRRVLFMQGPDMRMYRDDEPFERLRATLPLTLPFEIVTVGSALARTAQALVREAAPRVVLNGIDKEVFGARRRTAVDGPLRVLVEGQPTLWFKGVAEALEAVELMQEPAQVTLVGQDVGDHGAPVDRVVTGLDPDGMARLYAEADVLVKLSRFEGLGLAPLEAFHAGVPCVVTPYGGHEDYVEHGVNGLVVGFDDVPGTAGWLDRLARERHLLERLSAGALGTAARWPDGAASSRRFAEALLEPAPRPADLRALVSLARAHGELWHAETGHLVGSIRWLEKALDEARVLVEELSMSRDHCAEVLEERSRELREARATFGYRAERRLRRLARR